MYVILSGIFISFILVHPANADPAIPVTSYPSILSGITTTLSLPVYLSIVTELSTILYS